MHRKPEIKTYEIDLGGSKEEKIDAPVQEEVNESIFLAKRQETIHQQNEETVFEHERAIRSNPFMFNTKDAQMCRINSIEDFNVKVKRKIECPFKEVLRTQTYKPSKRKKIILGSIKGWIKDFKDSKSRVSLRASDIKESVRPIEVKKIKVISYIFIPLGLALLAIIYFRLTKIWDVSKDFTLLGREWHLNFGLAYENAFAYPWVNIVASAGLYISVASVLFIGLYNSVFNEYFRYSKSYGRLSDSLSGKISSEFNAKAKKTLRYYKKALSKSECNMDPLPIKETGVTNVDFGDLQALSDVYEHKMAKMKSRKNFMYFFRFVLFKGTYLCSTGVFGYVVVELMIGLVRGGN